MDSLIMLCQRYIEIDDELTELSNELTNTNNALDKIHLEAFHDRVFDLIDMRIKAYEHKPFSAPISNPTNPNFDDDVDRLARLSELEQLRKELKE